MICEHDQYKLEIPDGLMNSKDINALVKSLAEQIEREAPNDSSLFFSLAQTGHEALRGIVKITCRSGRFLAQATASTPQALLETLASDIRHQLKQWKVRRFLTVNSNLLKVS